MAKSTELMVYVNGQVTPESKAVISAFDRGFRWGDSVYDVARTFGGKSFRMRAHLDRLYRSLKYTRIDPGMTEDEMEEVTEELVTTNRPLLGHNEDFTVTQVVSRGNVGVSAPRGPNVVIYCQKIRFQDFAKQYATGVRVVTPSTRRTPPQCVSPKAKIANKMNHFVADFEAKEVDPQAMALMLDLDGNIAECTGANFLFVSDGVIKVPNRRQVLPGISMATVLELAENLGIPIEEGDYTVFDVIQADEAIIASTSYCMVSAASINGLPIGDELPGPITRGLLAAWSDLAGVNIVDQAMSHLPKAEREALSKRA